MTFHHPAFLLLLALVPLPWIYWRATPGCSRGSLLLKCVALVALVLALADLWLSLPTRKLAVTMVMDTSANTSQDSRNKGEALFQELQQNNWGAELRLITVANQDSYEARTAKLGAASKSSRSIAGSDLQAGLQLALATLPQPGAGRVLLFTDGNETQGHLINAVWQAKQMGVPVFVTPAGGDGQSAANVQSATLPQRAFSGERFTVSLVLNSPRSLPAELFATCQGKRIGSASVQLEPGANPISMEMTIHGQGTTLIQLSMRTAESEQLLLSRAITLRRVKVLYVFGSNQPSEPLLNTLRNSDVDVQVLSNLPEKLNSKEWDALVLDDFPVAPPTASDAANLESYVSSGGGLVLIAGEHTSQLLGNPASPLTGLLPVRGAPENPDESMSVVLVLDRSGSMTGQKIQKAREAARASLRTLRPTDRVGIIAFNDQFRWVAPLQPASDIPKLVRLIDSITADGSTRIYPPLRAAFNDILREKTSQKHMLLLTDGVSDQEELPQLMDEAAAQHVTISTIGLGSDVLRTMLENLARSTHGRSYFVDAESDLPQVMSAEIQNAKASLIKEGAVKAAAAESGEMVAGIRFSEAPPLLGFVRAKAKERAETLARLQTGEPLLVRWQYGLGQVVAFMSDARGRWAAQWVGWQSFGRLWPQVVRGVSSEDRRVHVESHAGTRDGEEIVAYDLLDGEADELHAVLTKQGRHAVLVQFPDDVVRPVMLAETRPDHYEAQVFAGKPGLYRVFSPPSSPAQLPEIGFYFESKERQRTGMNRQLLATVADFTGGRLNPTAEQILDRRGTLVLEPTPVWPYILVLVLLVNFVEIAVRRGLFQRGRYRSRA